MNEIEKVFAYITRDDHLLVFRHAGAPEAGIQVTAGTLKPGEEPAVGVLREAREETGLADISVVRLLGVQRWDSQNLKYPLHIRHFFHLNYNQPTPDTWQHWEPDPDSGDEIEFPFEFFWARMPDEVPPLIGDHDYFLPALYNNVFEETV